MEERLIETTADLNTLCQDIQGSPWLALDTEFMREKTYSARLCLLQLHNGEVSAGIDPLALEDLGPLLGILYDPGVVKVFHAGRQDLEIFQQLWGRLPSPLFDTQLAAAMLGLGDQIGYGNLVQQLLGRELEKGHTRTDWCRRPLEPAQLRYALDDVIYLGQIYQVLERRLREQGRLEWLQEEFALLADPATYRIDPRQMWRRVKGQQRLKGVQLAVLQELAAWREEQAIRSDRPRRWILKDEVLLELARRQPAKRSELQRIRGLEEGTIKRHGERLLALIAEARQRPREQWPVLQRPPPRLSPEQEAMVDLLMAGLRLLAEEAGITPSAIAGRRDLERLAAGDSDGLELLRGWRRRVAGTALQQIMTGERALRVEDGRLRLIHQDGD
ncbi:MAG TPA: ribonuclease D [Sedimenticola thiotaurini]|uniref:Ribonuclease D n=1 Tax=Sedimenticola thiotaurini TaxID=1543721 RepID=A0A831WA94_9GAMM|nr:ribonuclease D [Sedimenticola thiotaurini]